MGCLWRQQRLIYIGDKNLQLGSRSTHMGSHNEERANVSKNCGILATKDLEDTIELTGRERD